MKLSFLAFHYTTTTRNNPLYVPTFLDIIVSQTNKQITTPCIMDFPSKANRAGIILLRKYSLIMRSTYLLS